MISFCGSGFNTLRDLRLSLSFYLKVSDRTIKNKMDNPGSLTLREIEILRKIFHCDYNTVIKEFIKLCEDYTERD